MNLRGDVTKIGHVMAFEYAKLVFTRRFWLGVLGLPALVVVIAGVGFLAARVEMDNRPVGYVDHSSALQLPAALDLPQPPPAEMTPLLSFPTEAAARVALDEGHIQGYYVVAADYFTSGSVRLVYGDRPPAAIAQRAFRDFLQANLVQDLPPQVARRLIAGAQFVMLQPDGSRQPIDLSLFLNALLPAILGFGFIIAIFTTSGYLMQAVVEEKENRTMEVLLTSLSPGRLMIGKILGISLVGLTQIGVWTAMLVGGLLWGRAYLPWLADLRGDWELVWVLAMVMAPAYLFFGAIMVAIGATVVEASEGQQVTGFLTLPAMIPFWFLPLFLSNPHSPLALAFTFFPLTAPVTVSIRMGVGGLPGWQLAVASALLWLSAGIAIWLAGRAFALGQLLYGQRLPWRRLVGLAEGGRP